MCFAICACWSASLEGVIWAIGGEFLRWCMHSLGVAVSMGVLPFCPNGHKMSPDPMDAVMHRADDLHPLVSIWSLMPHGMSEALCTQTEYRPLRRTPAG